LNGSHGMLLLSVQVQRYLVQTEMLEIERVARQVSVERPVAHQSDDYARGKLYGKQFLVTHVQVILRNRKRLAHHASNRILCSSSVLAWAINTDGISFTFPTNSQPCTICALHASALIRQNESLLRINFIFTLTSFNI